jgi:hypothetical protein
MVFEMGLRLELQELGLPTVPKEFGQSSPLQDLMSLQPLPSQLPNGVISPAPPPQELTPPLQGLAPPKPMQGLVPLPPPELAPPPPPPLMGLTPPWLPLKALAPSR